MIKKYGLELKKNDGLHLTDYISPKNYEIDEQSKNYILKNINNDFDLEHYMKSI